MFDTTGLIEVKMNKRTDGSYFVNESDELVAKTCGACKEILPAASFNKRSAAKYGKQRYCRDCQKAKKDAWHTENRDQQLEYYKEYAQEHPERASERRAKNSARTPEQILEDQKRIRPKGTKRCGKCHIVYPLAAYHRDSSSGDGLSAKCKECACRRTQEYYRRPYLLHWTRNGIPLECYVCGEEWEHSDHVIPSILDGIDEAENRLPMCEHHNTSKNGTPLLKWLHENYPERSEEIMQRVFDYHVDPFTKQDIVWRLSDEQSEQ